MNQRGLGHTQVLRDRKRRVSHEGLEWARPLRRHGGGGKGAGPMVLALLQWALRVPTLAPLARFVRMAHRRSPWEARAWLLLPVLWLGMLLERGLFVMVLHPPWEHVYSDMDGYVDRGWRLSQSNITLNRFDAFFPPGTHILLAPLFKIMGSKEHGLIANAVLYWLLGAGVLMVVGLLALRIFKHPVPAVIVSILLWSYWPFINYAGYFLSETPVTFFTALALLVWWKAMDVPQHLVGRRLAWLMVAGFIGGLAMVIRPQTVLTMAALGLFMLRPKFPFIPFKEAFALAVPMLIPPLLGIALNSHAAGERVGLANNGGFNFFQGHCEVTTVETKSNYGWYVWASPARLQRLKKEGRPETKTTFNGHMAWENSFFLSKGLQCIRDDGWSHLHRVSTNVADFFWAVDPWPASNGDPYKILDTQNDVYCFSMFGCVLLVFWRRRSVRPEQWLVVMLATMMPVCILFYGDSRFRIPYDFLGMLLFAGIISSALKLRRR